MSTSTPSLVAIGDVDGFGAVGAGYATSTSNPWSTPMSSSPEPENEGRRNDRRRKEETEDLPNEVTEDSPGAGLLGDDDDIPEPNEPA